MKRITRRLTIATALGLLVLLPGCEGDSGEATRAKLREQLATDRGNVETRVELAQALFDAEVYSEAVDILGQGLKQNPKNEAMLHLMAKSYSRFAESTEEPGAIIRLKMSRTAARHWRRFMAVREPTAELLHQWANAERFAKNHDEAVLLYLKAIFLEPANPDFIADLGRAYNNDGKYEEAEQVFLEAISQGQRYYRIDWNLGIAQASLGDYAEALESYHKALAACPEERREALRGNIEYTENLNADEGSEDAGWAHYWAGNEHKEKRRSDLAAMEYEKALKGVPADQYGVIGWAGKEVASFAAHVQDLDKALVYLERAIEAYTKSDDYQELARAYDLQGSLFSGIAYEKEGEERRAFLQKSLHAREKQAEQARRWPHMMKHVLASKANLLFDLHGAEDSRFQKAREEMCVHLPQSGPVTDCARSHVASTEAYFRRREDDPEGARELLEMLRFPSRKDAYAPHVLRGIPNRCIRLAHVYQNLGQFERAMECGVKALQAQEVIRSRLGTDEYRRRVSGTSMRTVVADNVLKCCLKLDKPLEAFNYSEQYKGRALLDLLASNPAPTHTDDASDESPKQEGLLAQLVSLRSPAQPSGDGAQPEVAGSITRTLDLEADNLQRLAEDVSAAHIALRSFEEARALTAEELQPMVQDFTFVSYTIGGWGTTAVILSPDGVQAVALEEAGRETLELGVTLFRQGLGLEDATGRDLSLDAAPAGAASSTATQDATLREISKNLYTLLIEPVLPFIKTELVYISPDDVLNHLPFEALTKDGTYLIEQFAIAYAPSANVLKYCMDRNRNRRESVLALGNPNLKNPAFRLVHAENEVNALQGLFPRVEVFTSDQATERIVKERAGKADIIHFACHGELNLDEPMLTALRLAPDEENDGYLHAGEVFEFDLPASLVVLSACNSALGELSTGNELMGLTRSFLCAGVPATIASLWTVDDRSTSFLMQAFYKNLATMNKAEALRQAKLATMKKYPSPFHWAAFCLQGDYR